LFGALTNHHLPGAPAGEELTEPLAVSSFLSLVSVLFLCFSLRFFSFFAFACYSPIFILSA
jgi:hypothetical protein